jgi:hypothetical protein
MKKKRLGIILLIITLMGGLGLGYLLYRNAEIRKVQTKAQTQESWQKKVKMATVRKGEGVEHALIRQIITNANAENFGFIGNKQDAKAVKKWAGKKAHQIAIKAGYVDLKTGREIRVKFADKVAYMLNQDKDGNLTVCEFEKGSDGKFKNIPTQINKVINKVSLDYSSAKFLGDSPNGVQYYEYTHQPMGLSP